ncbi:serine/threonine-protein kinase [Actinomycetes bacterium KLBMP 9759]
MRVAGRYRMHEKVGEGGMGTVWRATDELLGREVAVKRLKVTGENAADVAIARERTMREARIAAALHHPNIVTIFDVIVEDGEPWLIMEYLPSRSLGSILRERTTLPPAEVAIIGSQVAAALAAAHGAGIVHRDVKPDNILVATSGFVAPDRPVLGRGSVVKLTDFGISHAATAQAITATNALSGTPAYFAPETARGEGTGPQTDLYSLGATLYAAVEGNPPFGSISDNLFAMLARISRGNPPPPRQAGPLTETLLRLTADNPDVRPAAELVHQNLQTLVTMNQRAFGVGRIEPTIAAAPALPYAAQPPAPSAGRFRLLLAALVTLVVAALVVAGIIVVRGASTTVADGATTSAAPPSATAAPVVPAVTDPRTVDPCSLIDVAALAPIGTALVDADNAVFSGCAAGITLPADKYATLFADMENPAQLPDPVGGVESRVNGLLVAAYPPEAARCERRIVLPDRNSVRMYAVASGGVEPATLCTIAQTAADSAVRTITTKGLGTRRPIAESSTIADLPACTLVSPAELAVVPNLDTSALSGFGGWTCSWFTTSGNPVTLRIDYYRRAPLTEGDGAAVDLRGRVGRVLYTPNSDCFATIPQRSYTVAGQPRAEVVGVLAYGSQPEAELCGYVTEVAKAVVTRLPPAS